MEFAAKKEEQATRLALLRGELARQGLDGFFVPIADEYMNEYVAPYAQRLAWLTGFTGSAGLALIMQDKAVLFADGRYTLQAAKEVDAGLVSVVNSGKITVSDYLQQHAKKGMRVGYDAFLHTKAWLDRLRPIVEKVGAKLVSVSANPMDVLWKDRPAEPKAPIYPHPLAVAGETAQSKIQRLAAELKKEELHGAVITSTASIAWLLNVRGGDSENTPLPFSRAILYADAKVDWFVAPEKATESLRERLDASVSMHHPDDFLPVLARLGAEKRKMRVDAQHTPARVLEVLSDAGAMLDAGVDPCELPKACKNNVEIEGIKAAHRRDGLALTRFLCWLEAQAHSEPVDELSAQEKLLQFRKMDAAFLNPSFPSISGAGANGAIVHYRARAESNRPLRQGELYLIDSGGQYQDGTTDVTRTVAIGEASAEMRKDFTLVLQGHIALAQARFPQGIAGSHVDVLARQFLWREGRDYDHGTGHGVGAYLGVHEGPQGISLRSTVPLKPGMVLSNEPGFYKEGAYGIRIENLVVVKESAIQLDGKAMLEFETLTLAPVDRHLIEAARLSAAEKHWLNAYHAQVFATHAPHLSVLEQDWLKQATAPLA